MEKMVDRAPNFMGPRINSNTVPMHLPLIMEEKMLLLIYMGQQWKMCASPKNTCSCSRLGLLGHHQGDDKGKKIFRYWKLEPKGYKRYNEATEDYGSISKWMTGL